jgi:hypothetical protein
MRHHGVNGMNHHVPWEFILPLLLLLFQVSPYSAAAQEPSPVGNQQDTLFLIKEPGLAGFINTSGEMVITTPFDRVESFSDGMAMVWAGKRYGFIDRQGNVVVEPRYISPTGGPWPEGFSEGLAAVSIEDPDNPDGCKFGFIDQTGNYVIDPVFDKAWGFHENLALVHMPDESGNGKYAFINKSGETVLEPEYEPFSSFQEGMAIVVDGDKKFGFIDVQGNTVLKPKYAMVMPFSEGLAVFADENNLCGFIDSTGHEVIPAEYFMANSFSDGLALVYTEYTGDLEQTVEGIWPEGLGFGFIDRSGKMVIEPRFTLAGPFHEGLARVFLETIDLTGVGGGQYYINKGGEMVLGPYTGGYGEDSGCYDFNEGLAVIGCFYYYGYIDKQGEIVAEGFESAGRFSEGLAPVRLEPKYGYIDCNGAIIVNPQYDEAYNFSDGLGRVRIGDRYGFVDASGKVAIEAKFEYVDDFHDGLARAEFMDYENPDLSRWEMLELYCAREHPWGFVDKSGQVAIEPVYEWAIDFSDGYAWVMDAPPIPEDISDEKLSDLGLPGITKRLNGFWNGFIDKHGNRILEYSAFGEGWIGPPSAKLAEGLVCFKGAEGYGYIDTKGEVVIDCQFDNAEDFSEGLAAVRVGDWETGKWGYIDKTGKMVIEPKYKSADPFHEGLANVSYGDGKEGFNGKYGFIDQTGRLVIPLESHFYYCNFSDGLAAIGGYPEKYGYIDKTGTYVIPPRFEIAHDFHDGLASVWIEVPYTGAKVDAYINKSGHIVWEAAHWEPAKQ